MTAILLVDDHRGFRAQARTLLETAGYDVVGEAEDAAGALRAVQQLSPDIVLLDIQLPDHDGFWVAARLAAHEWKPVIIMISSRQAADYGARVSDPGITGFIHKADLSRARLEELLEASA